MRQRRRSVAITLPVLLAACLLPTEGGRPPTGATEGLVTVRLDGRPWLAFTPLDSVVVGHDPQLDFFVIHAFDPRQATLRITVCATPTPRAFGFRGADSATAFWWDRRLPPRARPWWGLVPHLALATEADSVVVTHLDWVSRQVKGWFRFASRAEGRDEVVRVEGEFEGKIAHRLWNSCVR